MIVGPSSRSAIGTLVERRSRYLLLVQSPTRLRSPTAAGRASINTRAW
jgi:IS30 family transposase